MPRPSNAQPKPPTKRLPFDTMKLIDGRQPAVASPMKLVKAPTNQRLKGSVAPNAIVARPQPSRALPQLQAIRRPAAPATQRKPAKNQLNQSLRSATAAITDIQLHQAIQKENAKFQISKIVYVPGKRLPELSTVEKVPTKPQQAQLIQPKQTSVNNNLLETGRQVKVSATGSTTADQPIVHPAFDTRFNQHPFTRTASTFDTETSLILEPHARAIAGNDGVAIAAPLSRAILREGTSTKVLFRPQSVAIAGANGKAHAQADLILEYIRDS